MAKFLLGLICGIFVSILAAVIVVFALARFAASFGERSPQIADNGTLIFRLEGDVPERAPAEIPFPGFAEQAPITVEQVWSTWRKAAADSRIKAVIFEPRDLGIGWGKMQEIHQEIVEFRKSGKPLVALLRGPGAREYYLASACDRIYMAPEDTLNLKGLMAQSFFLKGTLDKIGVRADVIHAGKYKDAGDVLTQKEMSPETREVLNAILDQYYGDLIDTIAKGRKRTPDQVRAAIDNGPFFGRQAKDAGFVDVLGYDDEVAGDLQKRLGQTQLNKIAIKSYVRVPASSLGVAGGKRIAFIVGQGDITRGSTSGGVGEASNLASGSFTRVLNDVANDSSIRGAILRIDSPGGDGVASDDILNAARDLSRKKPLVISMGDVAGSGGYFIAMTGDPIVAYPNTLTGSIGVIMAKFDLHGLYDKIGITKQMLTRGQYADLDSDYEPLAGKNLEKMTQEINHFYMAFKERVAQGRRQSVDRIETVAQGRVWTGAQAKQNGLVDDLGGIDSAIAMVKKRANIGASEKVTLVVFPPKRTVLDVLMSKQEESAEIESKLRTLTGGLPITVLAHGGILKIMPFSVEVR